MEEERGKQKMLLPRSRTLPDTVGMPILTNKRPEKKSETVGQKKGEKNIASNLSQRKPYKMCPGHELQYLLKAQCWATVGSALHPWIHHRTNARMKLNPFGNAKEV